jgi:hypothetical protein
MLSVNKPFKIRVEGDYIICDGYTFKDLRMDLLTGDIFILVDFYREKETHFTREYRVGGAGEVDVNKLIDDLHIRLDYEFNKN